jgi:hypothetical protein
MVDRAKTTNWRSICELISGQCQLGSSGRDVLLVSGFNDDPELNEPVLKLLHL